MKRAVLLVTLVGCSQVFGLEPPSRGMRDDAAVRDAGFDAMVDGLADASEPSCFRDDFSAAPGPAWVYTGATAYVTVTNGQLHVAPPGSTAGSHGLQTNAAFDLANSSAEVSVVQAAPASSSVYTYFTLAVDSMNYYSMGVVGGTLLISIDDAGTTSTQNVAYDAAADRFWRISYDTTVHQVQFSTRASATDSWVLRYAQGASTTTGEKLALGVAVIGTTTTNPGEAVFDDVLFQTPTCTP